MLFKGPFATLAMQREVRINCACELRTPVEMSVNKVAAEEYGSDKPIFHKPTDER